MNKDKQFNFHEIRGGNSLQNQYQKRERERKGREKKRREREEEGKKRKDEYLLDPEGSGRC